MVHCVGAYPLCGALSLRGLLHPIKPAYNQSWSDGRLRLTASAFNPPWISMPAVLVTVPTVLHISQHPLWTSTINACHLQDFMVQGKITEAYAVHANWRHPIRTIGVPTSIIPHFHAECPFCRNRSNLSWLWQAPNNAGLHILCYCVIPFHCFDTVSLALGMHAAWKNLLFFHWTTLNLHSLHKSLFNLMKDVKWLLENQLSDFYAYGAFCHFVSLSCLSVCACVRASKQEHSPTGLLSTFNLMSIWDVENLAICCVHNES